MSADGSGEVAQLLEAAREALRHEIVGGLQGEQRYLAAMIGNTMAIAARALRDSGRGLAAEEAALRLVLGARQDEDLRDLRQRLVAEIRAGRFDGQADHYLRPALRALVDARLAISNPEYRVG